MYRVELRWLCSSNAFASLFIGYTLRGCLERVLKKHYHNERITVREKRFSFPYSNQTTWKLNIAQHSKRCLWRIGESRIHVYANNNSQTAPFVIQSACFLRFILSLVFYLWSRCCHNFMESIVLNLMMTSSGVLRLHSSRLAIDVQGSKLHKNMFDK